MMPARERKAEMIKQRHRIPLFARAVDRQSQPSHVQDMLRGIVAHFEAVIGHSGVKDVRI